jgi:predicted GNAT superfamily acetyltransferase
MDIRRLQTVAELRAAEDLQRAVWRFPWRDVIPVHEMVAAIRSGGHVFGAFDGRRLAGFGFGTPGLRGRRPFHYSRMVGVLPEYRDRGVGFALKRFQRRLVIAQGLDLVRWTYDPLQSRNARFNIEKLGCTAREYLVNAFGAMESRMGRGLETDRFLVDWAVRSRRVERCLAGRSETPPFAEAVGGWAPAIDARALKADVRRRERRVSVEIPWEVDRLPAAVAKRWRAATREAFLAYFVRGYVVMGYAVGDGRGLYLLQKR